MQKMIINKNTTPIPPFQLLSTTSPSASRSLSRAEIFGIKTKIKEQRNKLNLTQELFSEKIGITQRQMSLIELGKSFPSPKTLSNIVKIANCKMTDLFDFETCILYFFAF